MIDPALRRARIAVSLLFLTNGALFANVVPRYPEIKASLGIDNAAYGLAVAAFPAGAIIAGLAAAALIRRFGSARVAVAGTALTACGILIAGCAPAVPVFALGLFLGGAMDAITDVAQNAHGLRVQRGYGRSILNSFHAIWSIGALLGGAMSAVAIGLRIPLAVHLVISGALLIGVALVALRFCLQGRDDEHDAADDGPETSAALRRRIPPRLVLVLAALSLIAVSGSIVEDSGSSWATLYLAQDLGAPAAVAALGFLALVGAQFVGRILGDRLVDRFGQRAVARSGGLVAAVGMGLALAFPSLVGSILGFAAAGLGIATLVPAALHAADGLPGLRHGAGITIVSWLLRLGFLLSPPVVGLIADNAGLRYGLLVVPCAGLLVVALAGVLKGRRP